MCGVLFIVCVVAAAVVVGVVVVVVAVVVVAAVHCVCGCILFMFFSIVIGIVLLQSKLSSYSAVDMVAAIVFLL